MSVRLWSINKWLRWTGFRLMVTLPSDPDGWTLIGLKFWGWAFVRHGEGVFGPGPRLKA